MCKSKYSPDNRTTLTVGERIYLVVLLLAIAGSIYAAPIIKDFISMGT